MKTNFRLRALLLILTLLFLLPTLAACGGGDTPTPSDTQSTEGVTEKAPSQSPATPAVTTSIRLTKQDAKNYTVIMPKSCATEIRDASLDLFDDMRKEGFELKECKYDGGENEKDIPTDACEILIGQTNRPQSAAHAVGLRRDDFTIAVENSRIIIVGGSSDAVVSGVAYFLENYVKEVSTINITKAHTVTGEYDYDNMIDLTVNGAQIYEYSFSLPFQTSLAFDYAVSLLSDTVAEWTAYTLSVKRAAAAEGKVIRIELSNDLEECEYSYSTEGDAWVIRATERTFFYAIRGVVAQIAVGASAGAFDFTDIEGGTFLMESDPAKTHSTLVGKLPVALCDQQNNAAVIIDLSAPDPTASSAVIWEWKATSALNFDPTRFKNRIDEFKLRYSPVLEKYIVCATSSAGFVGIAEYPSGKAIWQHDAPGYGPHSIDYLPTGNVAIAYSGNGAEGKQEIRLYAVDANGVPTKNYVRDDLPSAHGIVWDNDWGVLWALGDTELVAYEIGGTPQEPTLTRIPGLGCKVASCGHDLSVSAINPDKLYLSSNSVYVFNKYANTLDTNFDGSSLIKAGSVKSIAVHTDGSILRAVAANVYAAHDTNILDVFRKDESGTWEKISYTFQNRAFYKAKPFLLR